MSRVALSKIRTLTLYEGQLTQARRLPAVKQLTCVGRTCNLYQPEVVRCYNEGGEGTEIDWVVCSPCNVLYAALLTVHLVQSRSSGEVTFRTN